MSRKKLSLLDPALCREACKGAFRKLDPRSQWQNPVMFVVWLGSALTTLVWLAQWLQLVEHTEPLWFTASIALWLWFTVLFANFAEALAEGRSKAQAASLRGLKQTVWAHKLTVAQFGAPSQRVSADSLRKGDVVQVAAGEVIPCDGEVIEGVASANPAAISAR